MRKYLNRILTKIALQRYQYFSVRPRKTALDWNHIYKMFYLQRSEVADRLREAVVRAHKVMQYNLL